MSRRHVFAARVAVVIGLVGVAGFALAACGGGGDDEATAGSTAVSVKTVDGMDVLVDSQGQTLYSPEQESGGKILCTGSCTAIWAPVDASGGTSGSGAEDLGTVKRPDGTEQVTFKGSPLYSFTEEGPGEVTGNGVNDSFNGTKFTWTVATGGGAAPDTSTTTPSTGGGGGGSYSY